MDKPVLFAAYGSALLALGCWGAFTTWKTRDRTLACLGLVFVASCLLPGFALLAGRFGAWMLLPLGVCYLALIPFPCYFRWANHGRIRIARGLLFLLVGVALIAAGVGLFQRG